MLKSSIPSPFLSVQSSLLSSIQRAKQRIFSRSTKQQTQNSNNISNDQQQMIKKENDQNNSLTANISSKQLLHSSNSLQRAKILKSNIIPLISQDSIQLKVNRDKSMMQIVPQRIQSIKTISTDQSNQSNIPVVVNAIKLLQQKIVQLQNKNKRLEQQLLCKTSEHFTQQKSIPHQQQQEQSDLKSYLLLKQQCQSLQKQNASLYQELSKRKQIDYLPLVKQTNGRKLNFHNEISQNVSQVLVEEEKKFQQVVKSIEYYQQQMQTLTQQLQQSQQQALQIKLLLQNEKKRNFTILKLHQQQIIKSQQLQFELNQIKNKFKDHQQVNNNKISKQIKRRNINRSGVNNTVLQTVNHYNSNNSTMTMMRQNHLKLQQTIAALREQLLQEKHCNQQRQKQNTQIYQKYIQVKQTFIELYKDLLKYHPQVVNTNIKFLYERIKKGEDIMLRSRSIIMGGSRYGRRSNNNRLERGKVNERRSSTNNNVRLSQFRSKSGKKGLKMEDLNSSKRSHSRDRTNSKNSNRSVSKSIYRSPYGQQQMAKRPTAKSLLSPNPKPMRHRSTTNSDSRKLSQIQNIIKQIKQLSRQIKAIKSQHRNLSVKVNNTKQHYKYMNAEISQEQISNQQRMNQLIEEYNQKSAKLQDLKSKKDRLAMETVSQGLG